MFKIHSLFKRDISTILLLIYWVLFGIFFFFPIPFFVRAVLYFILITTSSLYYGFYGGLVATIYYIILVFIYQLFNPINFYGLLGGSFLALIISLMIGLHRDQLKKSEVKYRELFTNSLNGLSLHQVVMEGEEVVDFIFLDVNKTFLEQVGYKEEVLIGQRVLKVFPKLEKEILEAFFQVAKTGEPRRIDGYTASLDKWYEISIFSPIKGQFIASSTDITERKVAEERLRTSKEQFETLVSNIPGVVYRSHFHGLRSMDFVSTQIQELTGYREDNFIGDQSHFFNALIYYEDRRRVLEEIKSSIGQRSQYSLEYRIIDIKGKVHWVSDQGQGVFNREGDLLYLDGFILDITSKKGTQEALRESEALFRSYVQNTGEIIFSLSPDGRLTYVSPNWTEDLGHRVKEVEGQNFAPFIHPDDLYSCLEIIDDLMLTGERVRGFEFRAIHKDGSYRWFHVSATPVYNTEKEVAYIVGSARNITEQKKAKEQLERSRDDLAHLMDEYRMIFNTTHDAIFIMDVVDEDTFVYRRTNRAHQEQTGLSLKEVKGKGPQDLFDPKTSGQIIENFRHCLKVKKEIMYEEALYLPIGEVIWQTMLSPVIVGDKVVQLVGSSRDITAYQRITGEIKRQKNLLNSIFHHAPIGIWVMDEHQRLLMVNNYFQEKTGISTPNPSITPEELSICKISDGKALAQDLPLFCEEEITFTDGQKHHLDVIKTKLHEDDGGIKGILGLGVDITERKRVQEALQTITSEQKMLLDTIETHVWYMQDENTYGKVNRSHARFHGLTPRDMEGKEILEVHDLQEGEIWQGILKKAFIEKRPIHLTNWVKNDLHIKRLLAITMTPHLKKDLVEYVVCSAEDITKEEQERKLLAHESEILSWMVKGYLDISSMADNICYLVESQRQGLYCSIMRYHGEEGILSCLAAPTLGVEFCQSFKVHVGPDALPCGQAVYRKKRILPGNSSLKGYNLLEEKGLKASCSQPILSQDEEVLGTVDIYSKGGENPEAFTIRLLETAASLAGIAIERDGAQKKINEYTMTIELKNLELEDLYGKMDKEVEKALSIHNRTLPTTFPDFKDLSIYAHYRPAAKMGGDFYNFKKIGQKLLFYLSDVTGHGLDGAMMSVFVKNTIDNYLTLSSLEEIIPSKIFHHLTCQYLKEGFPEDYFISLLLGILDLSTGELIYSSAGLHVPPLAFLQEGRVLKMAAGNLPISSTIPIHLLTFKDDTIKFPKGTTLFFTTDGLTEQKVGDEWYGDRLEKVLKDHYFLPPEAIAQGLNKDFQRFFGQETGDDDITFLILQLTSTEEIPSLSFSIPNNFFSLQHTKKEIVNFLREYVEDPYELMISFHELLINAMEHGNKSHEGCKIQIEVEIHKGFLKIAVGDEGPGFDWDKPLQLGSLTINEEVYERGRGLGLMLTSMTSDFFYYNHKGNVATIIKLR